LVLTSVTSGITGQTITVIDSNGTPQVQIIPNPNSGNITFTGVYVDDITQVQIICAAAPTTTTTTSTTTTTTTAPITTSTTTTTTTAPTTSTTTTTTTAAPVMYVIDNAATGSAPLACAGLTTTSIVYALSGYNVPIVGMIFYDSPSLTTPFVGSVGWRKITNGVTDYAGEVDINGELTNYVTCPTTTSTTTTTTTAPTTSTTTTTTTAAPTTSTTSTTTTAAPTTTSTTTTTTTGAPVPYTIDNAATGSSLLACAGATTTSTVYALAGYTVPIVGMIFYDSPSLTTPFIGSVGWRKLTNDGVIFYAGEVDINGELTNYVTCP
jgi:hypothetical protein